MFYFNKKGKRKEQVYKEAVKTWKSVKNDKDGASDFQLSTYVMRSAVSDAAGVLDPLLILIQRKLISYILYQFCSIKVVKIRRPRFGFCYFC